MSKTKTRKIIKILFLVSALLALLGAAALFITMEKDYDADIMHFKYGSPFALLAGIICVGGAGVCVAGFFSAGKNINYDLGSKYTFIGVMMTSLAGFSSILYTYVLYRNGIPSEKVGLYIAQMVFTVLAAVYFLLKTFGVTQKHSAVAVTGVFPAIMTALSLLNYYFNRSEPLNAPVKIYKIIMLVTLMLFFIADTGVEVKRPDMGRKYTFAGLLSVSVGGAVTLSRLAARIVDVDTFSFDVGTEAFHFVLWLYAAISFGEKLLAARENETEEAFFNNKEALDGESAGSDDAEEAAETVESAEAAETEEEAEPAVTVAEVAPEDKPEDKPEATPDDGDGSELTFSEDADDAEAENGEDFVMKSDED